MRQEEPEMNDKELAEEEKAIFELLHALVRRCRILNDQASAKEMSKCAAIIAALRREPLSVDLDHVPADVPEAIEMLRRAKALLLSSESMVRYWRDKVRQPSGEMVMVTEFMKPIMRYALGSGNGELLALLQKEYDGLLSAAEAEGRKS
jgi:hypothetical protein